MAATEDRSRSTRRSRTDLEGTAQALVDFPRRFVLDFNEVTIEHLDAGKRILGIPVSDVALTVKILATCKLPAYSPVTSQGKRADSNNASASFGRVIGLNTDEVQSGQIAQVVTNGEIENSSWNWKTGDPIFLNGTGLSCTPPVSGFVQQLGTAKESTKIVIDLKQPILL